jgi:hypothetical protein
MKYITLGLGKLTVAEKVAQGNAVKAGMTNNPNFTTPNPSLTAFGHVVTVLTAKQKERNELVEAAKVATADLHAAEQAYDLCVTHLAAYAESAALGDQQKLESAGFTVRKAPEAIVGLDMVSDLKVTNNSYTGILFAKWKPVRGAKAYEIQICPEPMTMSGWRSIRPSTASRTEIDGLTSGTKIWVQVRAVAKKLAGPWSQPASKVVP